MSAPTPYNQQVFSWNTSPNLQNKSKLLTCQSRDYEELKKGKSAKLNTDVNGYNLGDVMSAVATWLYDTKRFPILKNETIAEEGVGSLLKQTPFKRGWVLMTWPLQ